MPTTLRTSAPASQQVGCRGYISWAAMTAAPHRQVYYCFLYLRLSDWNKKTSKYGTVIFSISNTKSTVAKVSSPVTARERDQKKWKWFQLLSWNMCLARTVTSKATSYLLKINRPRFCLMNIPKYMNVWNNAINLISMCLDLYIRSIFLLSVNTVLMK